MKNLNIKILLILSILITNLFSQWEIINQGLIGNPTDADFVNENVGWVAIDKTLLKTEDGGETWQEIKLDWRISGLDFVTPQIGWALGSGSIIKTENGGVNWIPKYQFQGDYPSDIFALNKDTVFVTGYSVILKTMDSGENWFIFNTEAENASLRSVVFFDDKNGIAAGGVYNSPRFNSIILITKDGGYSWQETIISEFNSIYELQIINDSVLFFSALSDTGAGLQLCKSLDTLNSWTVQKKFEYAYFESAFPFHVISTDTIFAINGEYSDTSGISSYIIKSTNSGIDWESIHKMPSWGFNKILFYKDRGHLIGTVGVNGPISSAYGPVIYSSPNYGATWDIKNMSYPFNDLYFINENKGFATGGSDDIHFETGELFVTHDGGKIWEISLSPGASSGPVQFLDDQLGFLLTSRKGIYKTEDGGNNWSHIYKGSNIWDMYFINETTGWISRTVTNDGRDFATIYSTIDGGEHWEAVFQEVVNNSYLGYKKIHILDSNNGWAVGDEGLMAKLSNGLWDSKASLTDLPLNTIFFSDSLTGWISAGYDPLNQRLYSTTNGGAAWDSLINFNYKIEDIFFQDENRGWIAGSDTDWKGVILLTENGGENWQILIDSLTAPITSLHFKEGQAWAAGERGLILHSYDGISWIEKPSNFPNSIQLFQNYPNPFNPSTTIEYQLIKPEKVNISIYNLLGQKVAVLVNKKQTAGNYKVEWDASSFASGVYLYRFKTDQNYVETRKLILLK